MSREVSRRPATQEVVVLLEGINPVTSLLDLFHTSIWGNVWKGEEPSQCNVKGDWAS